MVINVTEDPQLFDVDLYRPSEKASAEEKYEAFTFTLSVQWWVSVGALT